MALSFGFDVVSTTSFCKFLRAGSQAAGKERKGVGSRKRISGRCSSGKQHSGAAGSRKAEQQRSGREHSPTRMQIVEVECVDQLKSQE